MKQVWMNSAQWLRSMRDRWTDEMDGRDGRTHGKIMLLSHTLTIRGSDVASSVEFHPMV